MEEVVAKKANMIPGAVISIVMGLVILVGGVVLGIQADETGAILVGVIVGLILIATGAVLLFGYLKSPRELIILKPDGKLYFAGDAAYYPHEITYVLIRLTRTNGIVNSTGGIDITINGGRIIKYKNVKQVKAVQQRLSDLRALDFARMSNAQSMQSAQSAQQD